MAWERLALIQAINESEATLQKVAQALGFVSTVQPRAEGIEKDQFKPDSGLGNDAVATEIVVAPTEKPTALFLRVNRIENRGEQREADRGRPVFLDNPALELDSSQAQSGTYRFATPPPLLSMPRLLPFLHQGLGQIRTTSRIDYARITRQIAQGKWISRLPRVKQRRWPKRLQIIVDPRTSLEPFWADFALIIAELKKKLGAEVVSAMRFDEVSFGEPQRHTITWPTQALHRWSVWQPPAPDVALLILGDLGMVENDMSIRYHWGNWIRQLRTHPAPILTLSPAMQAPASRQLNLLAKPHPLHDQVRLPRHPAKKGFQLTEPDSATVNDILAWLSVLPIIDTGLLRRLRRGLQWGGSELETLIWNHSYFSQTSLGLRGQDANDAQRYRERYQQHYANTPQAQQFWEIVQAHHAGAFEGLRQLEGLTRSILEKNEAGSARDYFQRVCATVMQTSANPMYFQALQAQCRTALASLPDELFVSEQQDIAYGLYAVAYQSEIQAGQWPESLKPGFEPARLQWLLSEVSSQQSITWQVLQTSAQGHFICQSSAQAATSTQPPIIVLQSPPGIPPTYQVLSSTPSQRGIVRSAQPLSAARAPLRLETSLQRVELEAIRKPGWAMRIRANRSGLAVELPTWQGKSAIAPWQPGSGSTPGRWQMPEPLGLDDWGLYADLTVNALTQRFRWIVPGTFLMGSPETEPERSENEIQHSVTLTQGFWLADSACTQALWQALMGENPAYFQDSPDQPVEQVSWDDVQRFIQVLNERLPDLQARLPTEAEWEYACRAGTTTPFSFGENITPEQVNYHGDYPYAGAAKGLFREKTVPVKSLPSNPWGLYEMHGNVWEWCADRYGDYPTAAVVDPSGPLAGQTRVLRGGSWSHDAWGARSADRSRSEPGLRRYIIGFRLTLGPVRHRQPESQAGASERPEAAAERSSQDGLDTPAWPVSQVDEITSFYDSRSVS